MISRNALIEFCTSTLDADRFRDAGLNGLQVEGKHDIRRLACAVSVSERVIRGALDWNADILLVHHGLFWGERAGPISGPLRARLQLLLVNDLSLAGYHLPLDAHPEIGNNARLIRRLGLQIERSFSEVAGQAIGFIGRSPAPVAVGELAHRVQQITDRTPTVLDGGPDETDHVAVVSGSGYSALEEAAELGCGVLVTGDVREPTMALARELGVTVIAGGHEATERLGIQALAELAAKQFGIETRFFAYPNPI
ncbi:MAG: Nif3-like dinuclear metal center hexameric protein [Nitrolancea sp.]